MRVKRQPVTAPETFVSMPFPLKGIDQSQAYSEQPPGTTPTATNVRGFEPGTDRARGGQRPGIGKYIATQVNGSNSIQELNYIIQTSGTIPGSASTLYAFYYTKATEIDLRSTWMYSWNFAGGATTLAAVADTATSIYPSTNTWSTIKNSALVASGTIPGNPNESTAAVCTDGTNFFFIVDDTTTSLLTTLSISPTGTVNYSVTGVGTTVAQNPSSAVVVGGVIYTMHQGTFGVTSGVTQQTAATGAAGAPFFLKTATDIATATYGVGQTISAGSIAAVGTLLAFPVTSSATNKPGLCFLTTAGAFSPSALLNLTAAGTPLPKVVAGGGAFFMLVPGSGATSGYVVRVSVAGAVVWTSATFTGASSSYAIGYDASVPAVYVSNDNGVSLSLDPATGSVLGSGPGTNITAFFDAGSYSTGGSSAGTAGDTSFNRALVLVAVSGGQLKTGYNGVWHTPATITGTISSSVKVVRSAVLLQKVWLVDGTNYTVYNPVTDTVSTWAATAGTMPVGASGGKPRLIGAWRGCIMLAGVPEDAHNWFLSKVDDPTNWDYSPTSVSPTQAIAGSVGPQGVVKDVVTAIVPYSDDVLFLGCNSSIWMFRGHPMEGGRIDLVSDIIGMAWGAPWCKDPYGAVYFMANRMGIYRMEPGQHPVRISQQIEQILSNVSIDSVVVRFLWDDALQGFHVFITHYASAQAESHLFWEQRTGAWRQDVFATNNHNPLCCLTFEGNTAADRAALIGSWDGYVRSWSSSQTTDDGTAIASSVILGPILTKDFDDILLKDIQGILATSSGSVTWSAYVGPTAEAALSTTAVRTGTWIAGRSYDTPVRWAGHAIWLKLSASNYWAMESVRARIAGKGKVRRRSGV